MTDTVGFGDLGGVGALWPIEGSWPQTNPSFFNFTKRTAVIGDVVQSSLDKISGEKDSSERNIEAAIAALQHVRLSFIHVLVLRIVKFVVKIFNEKYNKIDHLLTTDHLSSLLIRKYTQILSPRVADYSPLGEFTVHGDINLSSLVQIGLYELQRHQFSQLKEILDAFKKDVNSESLTPDERLKSFDHLPDYLKKILQTLANTQHEVSVRDNPKILTEEIADQSSILEQLDQVFSSQVESYQALTQLEGEGSVKISEEQRESLFALIQANDEVLGELSNERNFDDKHCVYDVSVERLMSEIPKSILKKQTGPITLFGTDYPTRDGTCIRDYIHVYDLGKAHITAMERLLKGAPSTCYNLGNGQGFTVKEVIHAIEEVTGLSVPTREGERRLSDPPILIADATKATRELQWRPTYPKLQTMIAHAWQAMSCSSCCK